MIKGIVWSANKQLKPAWSIEGSGLANIYLDLTGRIYCFRIVKKWRLYSKYYKVVKGDAFRIKLDCINRCSEQDYFIVKVIKRILESLKFSLNS
jgi:hypothetical protein